MLRNDFTEHLIEILLMSFNLALMALLSKGFTAFAELVVIKVVKTVLPPD
jgi:hypothetical protein